MAREIVTRIWCDVCLQEGEQVEAEEMPPVAIGTMKPRLLALCERHTKEYFTPLREVLVELGQIIPATGVSAAGVSSGGTTNADIGVWPCPVPDCEKHTVPYTHRQSLRNHCREIHGTTWSELRTKYPGSNEDPVSNQQVSRRNEQVTVKQADCPECGKPFKYPEYAQPARALGVHRAKQHGVAGISKTRAKKAAKATAKAS